MGSALLATDFVTNLTDETLVYLFNSCVDGITTNGRVKDGGFTTAKIIIEEMAVRRKIPDLELARFRNCEPVFFKLMTFVKSADRSAKGRMPKVGQNSDSLDSLFGTMEYKSGPESIEQCASVTDDLRRQAHEFAKARAAQFMNYKPVGESTSQEDLERAAEEIRRQQDAVETRTRLSRESLGAYIADCLSSDEPSKTE